MFEAFNKPSEKNNISSKRLEFEKIKSFLGPKLSGFEKKLLTLPDVLQQEIDAGGEPDYLTFLVHLRDCFYNYFSTPTDKEIPPDIQWIDPQFISTYYPAQDALDDLKINLFNEAAVKNLKEKLREAGAFSDQRKDFYLWNTSPYNWDDISYQARSVEWKVYSFLTTIFPRLWDNIWGDSSRFYLTMPNNLVPDQYGALGDFTINAIPEGYVEPKGNGKYDICVNKMYYFINDSFNFEGFGDLSLWRLKDIENPNDTFWKLLFNNNFSNFTRHGYGREFPVLSRLREIENFQPYCLKNQDAK